jgi:hypothetical protein
MAVSDIAKTPLATISRTIAITSYPVPVIFLDLSITPALIFLPRAQCRTKKRSLASRRELIRKGIEEPSSEWPTGAQPYRD